MPAARERARIPSAATAAIAVLLAERVRAERKALRALDPAALALAVSVRELIARIGARPWSVQEHARVMRDLRALGRRFGAGLSELARTHATEAAAVGVAQQPKAIKAYASAALGRRVQTPVIDERAATSRAVDHVRVRTEDVGARTGEEIAAAIVAASYLEATKVVPAAAAVVASTVAGAATALARDRGARVLTTEMVAGFEWGADEGRAEVLVRAPRLRKSWDASLDRRVCSTCAGLHHQVVDANDTFPGGIDDAPAHPRCRCATWPWTDDWTSLCDSLGIGPGVRTGVLASVETQLPSFGTLLQ